MKCQTWQLVHYRPIRLINFGFQTFILLPLTLILLTWRKWWAPNNASKWQMGFNSAFKGLIHDPFEPSFFLSFFLSFFRSLTSSTYSLYVYRSHSVGLLWTTDQPVAETSTRQHTTLTKETGIHAAYGNRTHNSSKRASVDLRRRPRGYWDRAFWTSQDVYCCRWRYL